MMDTDMPIASTPPLPGHPAPAQAIGPVRSRRPGHLQQAIQGACVVVLAFASYYVISHFVLQSVKVVGKSMNPTLGDSERCLLNRWVYYFQAPSRLDVVVIEDPGDNGLSVKRVIAVEGDTVALKRGHVYVNGQELKEPYLERGTQTYPTSGPKEAFYKCEKGQFFLLGDNRPNSADSRMYGPVPRNSILGKIIQ